MRYYNRLLGHFYFANLGHYHVSRTRRQAFPEREVKNCKIARPEIGSGRKSCGFYATGRSLSYSGNFTNTGFVKESTRCSKVRYL